MSVENPTVGLRRRLYDRLLERGPVRPQIDAIVRRAFELYDFGEHAARSVSGRRSHSQQELGKGRWHARWKLAPIGRDELAMLRRIAKHQSASMASVLESMVIVDLQLEGHELKALRPPAQPRPVHRPHAVAISPGCFAVLAAQGKVRPQLSIIVRRAYERYDFSAMPEPPLLVRSGGSLRGYRQAGLRDDAYEMLRQIAEHRGMTMRAALDELLYAELECQDIALGARSAVATLMSY